MSCSKDCKMELALVCLRPIQPQVNKETAKLLPDVEIAEVNDSEPEVICIKSEPEAEVQNDGSHEEEIDVPFNFISVKQDFENDTDTLQLDDEPFLKADNDSKLDENDMKESTYWNGKATRTLIDLYKRYREAVGQQEVRNMKQLWELLALKVNRRHGTNFTPSQCENRWRVLERNYKKVVDNKARKYFEYQEEMNSVLARRRKLQAQAAVQASAKTNQAPAQPPAQQTTVVTIAKVPVCTQTELPSTSAEQASQTVPQAKKKLLSRNSTLDLMRQDKKRYYDECLRFQRERLETEREKLREKQYENRLRKERNEIFKKYLESKVDLPFDI